MKQNKAFTLIELLVVVLIIGILAAIALPQYRVAVGKARFAALIPVVDGFQKAVESYYLTHGQYPTEYSGSPGLEITAPGNCQNLNPVWSIACDNGIIFDILDYGALNILGIDTVHKFAYVHWLFFSDLPNQKRCVALASDGVANKVCQSYGGQEINGEDYRWVREKIGEPIKVYSM